MIVHGIRLDKVGDVEPVICVFLCVGEPKIEPLGVSLAVVIRFHSQIILEFTYLSGSFEIATFESTLKYKSPINLILLDIVRI